MDAWQYVIILGGCLVLTLPLELVLGARVYRSPRRLVLAMLPMLAIFLTWDVVGILREHWWYSERYVSGIRIGPMPLEELLFFLVIPICGLLTYEAVGRVITLLREPGRLAFRWPDGLVRVAPPEGTKASSAHAPGTPSAVARNAAEVESSG